MYWAVLTLGPIMMGGGLIVTSYIMSVPLLSQTATTIEASLGFLKLIPLFLEIFSFTLLYWLVPNVRVQFRYAIIGGIFATLLFEIAKQGFAWYTRTFSHVSNRLWSTCSHTDFPGLALPVVAGDIAWCATDLHPGKTWQRLAAKT